MLHTTNTIAYIPMNPKQDLFSRKYWLTLESTFALEFDLSTTIFSWRGVDPPVDDTLLLSFRDMLLRSLLNNLFLLLQNIVGLSFFCELQTKLQLWHILYKEFLCIVYLLINKNKCKDALP